MLRSCCFLLLAACVLRDASAFCRSLQGIALPSSAHKATCSQHGVNCRASRGVIMAHNRDSEDDGTRSKDRRDALRLGLFATTMPWAAAAIDMNNAAGLKPDGTSGVEGIDLEGIGSGMVDRGDKPAFERKMKAKQQGKKAPQDRRESTKAERAAQAALAVFEDDVLGYAFAVGPKWEGSTQKLDNGGQIIAFADKTQEKPDKVTRIILVAQPSPVASYEELERAIEPQGKVLAVETIEKASGKSDGFVRVFDYENKGIRYTTIFSLRVKPSGAEQNWLVTLTAQTPTDTYKQYEKEFQDIIKSFRFIYPVEVKTSEFANPLTLPDEDLGTPNKYIEINPKLLELPFFGKGVEYLPYNPIKQFFY